MMLYTDEEGSAEVALGVIACPFEAGHVMPAERFLAHVELCQLSHSNVPISRCPYLPRHVFLSRERMAHLESCAFRRLARLRTAQLPSLMSLRVDLPQGVSVQELEGSALVPLVGSEPATSHVVSRGGAPLRRRGHGRALIPAGHVPPTGRSVSPEPLFPIPEGDSPYTDWFLEVVVKFREAVLAGARPFRRHTAQPVWQQCGRRRGGVSRLDCPSIRELEESERFECLAASRDSCRSSESGGVAVAGPVPEKVGGNPDRVFGRGRGSVSSSGSGSPVRSSFRPLSRGGLFGRR